MTFWKARNKKNKKIIYKDFKVGEIKTKAKIFEKEKFVISWPLQNTGRGAKLRG